MPLYEYECQNPKCGFGFEVKQGITEDSLKKCPACGKHKLERLLFAVPGFVRQEASTLGQLAERNSKKMGKEGLASAQRKHEEKQEASRQAALQELEKKLPPGAKITARTKDAPWYGSLPQKLKRADKQRLNKYIMDGKV